MTEDAAGRRACRHASRSRVCPLRHWPRRLRFGVEAQGDGTALCLWHAFVHPRVLRNALATSVLVGTLLLAINQGDALLEGRVPSDLWWKVPLTYLVPLLVSSWGALSVALIPTPARAGRGR